MEFKNLIRVYIYFSMIFVAISCDKVLEEKVYSEMSNEEALNSKSGLSSILNSGYNQIQLREYWYYFFSAMSSGETYNQGGSISAQLTPLFDFTWTSNLDWFQSAWTKSYGAIRDANIVLDNVDNDNFDIAFKKEITAEAKFIRGRAYSLLYDWYGPVPLYLTSSTDSLDISRPTIEKIHVQIENDLIEASIDLPVDAQSYGRATKGAALGLLCKFYLNTKQWTKSADIAEQIINMNKYDLLPNYGNLFSVTNEGNIEMIWVNACTPQGNTNQINAVTFPNDFPLPNPNNAVFAARAYLFDQFVNSFNDNDSRKSLIVTEYTNTSGKHVQLLGNNQSLPLKYDWDPNASGPSAGNDIPVIRYADILISRAEALNEINGPTQESIDLINKVRNRAGVSGLNVADFDKESFRNEIFKEREWEFYYEMKSREDQIRQGTFISKAIERGKNAQPYHKLFPIPQGEIDASLILEQNTGY